MEELLELKKKKIDHLHFREDRGYYQTKYPVPDDLKEKYKTSSGKPKPNVVRVVGTGTAREIKAKHRENIFEIEKEFRALRERKKRRISSLDERLQCFETSFTLSNSMMAEIILRWHEISYETAREGLLYFIDLKNSHSGDMNGEIPDYLDDMHRNLLNLTEGRSFEEGLLNEAVDLTETKRILLDNEINLDQTSHSFRKMRRYVWEIMTELYQWEKDCFDSGTIKKFKSKTVDELSSRPRWETQNREKVSFSPRTNTHLESKCIEDVLEAFVKWKAKHKDHADSFDSDIKLLQRLVSEVFGNISTSSITADGMEKLRETLSSLPNRRGKEYQNVNSFNEAIKLSKKLDSELITHKTANKLLGYLVNIFNYASKSGWFDEKLLLDFKIKFNDHNRQGNIALSEERREFSKDELSGFFSIPIFTGCLNQKQGLKKEGNKIFWNYKYWGVLIALYTGMRPAEIAEMHFDQIEEQDGVRFFNIRKKHKGQSLKTGSSIRKIPVHNELIELGLLDYISNREPDDLLLHDFKKRNGHPKDPKELSRWFNNWAIEKYAQKKEEEKLDFYCFRHTFATTSRHDSKLELGEIDELCGWSSEERKWFRKAMRENYTKREYDMKELKESVDRINYPSIDLSHLHLNRLNRIERYQFELPSPRTNFSG